MYQESCACWVALLEILAQAETIIMLASTYMGQKVPSLKCNISYLLLYLPCATSLLGIRNMLRVTLQLSQSKIAIPHRIHELKGMLFKTQRAILDGISTTLNPEYGERVGGRDIYPDNENRYVIKIMCSECYSGSPFYYFLRYIISEDNEDASVSAAVMKHTIPCVGYVIEESRGKGSKLKV